MLVHDWLDTMREGRTLTLRLGVHTGLDDVPDQVWEVGARHTRAFFLGRIRSHRVDDFGGPRLALGTPGAVQPAQLSAARRPATARFCGTSTSGIARSPVTGFRSIAISTRHSSRTASRAAAGAGRRPRSPAARVCGRACGERPRAYFPYPPRPPHSGTTNSGAGSMEIGSLSVLILGGLVLHRGCRLLCQSRGYSR